MSGKCYSRTPLDQLKVLNFVKPKRHLSGRDELSYSFSHDSRAAIINIAQMDNNYYIYKSR